ncbi:GxxExxY protein [soil metagenome]
MLYLQETTGKIIGAAIEVHRVLGPGLLESAYEECLNYELGYSGLRVQRQIILPLDYKEVSLDAGFRIDLLVENSVIVEIKSVASIADIHKAQLITYLKLSGCAVGLLINFNETKLTNGLHRFVV